MSSWSSRTWFSCRTRKACCWSCWLERHGKKKKSLILTFLWLIHCAGGYPRINWTGVITHHWVWTSTGGTCTEIAVPESHSVFLARRWRLRPAPRCYLLILLLWLTEVFHMSDGVMNGNSEVYKDGEWDLVFCTSHDSSCFENQLPGAEFIFLTSPCGWTLPSLQHHHAVSHFPGSPPLHEHVIVPLRPVKSRHIHAFKDVIPSTSFPKSKISGIE